MPMDPLPEQGAPAPIEDFDYDSSGSLSSLDSAFGEGSDSPIGLSPFSPHSADLGGPADPGSPASSRPGSPRPVDPGSPQTADTGPGCAPVKRKRGRPQKPGTAAPPASRRRQSVVPSPRPTAAAAAAVATDATGGCAGLVTTGAFLTRTTLRKLGVADILAGPETAEAGLEVGSRVKVLSLDKKWYTAAVLAIGSGKALVHYPGWDHRYNEWIPAESRRLLHRGKPDPGVCGSTAAMAQLLAECADGPVLAAPDLARAIGDAFGAPPTAAAAGNPTSPPEPARAKGRPPGSRNRRRAGHTKSRARRARQPDTCDPPAAVEEESPAAAPEIPEELRIPEVRMARAAENPYMRRHQLEDIFGADSDGEAGNHRARATRESDSAAAAAGRAGSDGAIWHLGRGAYVTTGAFLTRRTVKSLAHSESTGGIMQDHHGYYPGQLVEVMNANRSWYLGRVISYADRKFLIHFNGWDHAHNEWVAAGSRRMRAAAAAGGEGEETEEDARRACVVLVGEYNAHVDDQERGEAERLAARRKPRVARQTPANPRI
ncbi:hypothetical protein IWQ57_005337, partial [Coemansia nantahalensis]